MMSTKTTTMRYLHEPHSSQMRLCCEQKSYPKVSDQKITFSMHGQAVVVRVQSMHNRRAQVACCIATVDVLLHGASRLVLMLCDVCR